MSSMIRLRRVVQLACAAALSFPVGGAHAGDADARPNVLVFLVDDMGVMDTSLPFLVNESGEPKGYPLNSFYRTSSMERLAEHSLRFSRFYAHSVCSPSRMSLMTGQSSARHGTTTWVNPFTKNDGPDEWNWSGPDEQSMTMPRVLQQAGYRTIHCGKAHFGPVDHPGEDPRTMGFDVSIAGCSWGQPGSYYARDGFGKGGRLAVPGLDRYHGSELFLTEVLTLEMKGAISDAVKRGQPFFAHMSHYALHAPFHSDPKFAAHYKDSGRPDKAQAFATLVEGMDQSLGDLLDHLDAMGVAENTLIVFLGDNGSDAPLGGMFDVASSAPLRGKKGTSLEGGMRAPLIVGWAKPNPNALNQKRFPIRSGVESAVFATINDVFPTVMSVTGAQAPDAYVIDGGDLSGVLSGQGAAPDQKFLMHFPHPHNSGWFTSYHSDNWKLVYHYKKQKGKHIELFDLSADPAERKNLASDRSKKVHEMMALMNQELDECGVSFPLNVKNKRITRPSVDSL